MTGERKIAKIMKSCEGVASVAEAAWQVNILTDEVWLVLNCETHVERCVCCTWSLLFCEKRPFAASAAGGFLFVRVKNRAEGQKDGVEFPVCVQ